MLIEAVKRPITYRWPGQEVQLIPGSPVDLPDERARRLLFNFPGKVRVVLSAESSQKEKKWLAGWREVTEITAGKTTEYSRFGSVMAAVAKCDQAFEQDDWSAFQEAAKAVREAMQSTKR